MLLGKPKDKFEVYNDLDDELVNLFRCVRDRPAEFLLELGLLPLNSRTEFGEWLKFHTGRRDPVLFLPTQDVILDNLLPMQQWAEQMKKALHDRANYKEVLQAAAFSSACATAMPVPAGALPVSPSAFGQPSGSWKKPRTAFPMSSWKIRALKP